MGNTDELCERDARTDGRVSECNDHANDLMPMVEIYETIEGEGTRAGFATVFVRVFGCNLRCTWCDTPYSYAPAQAEQMMSIAQIVAQVSRFKTRHLCLTGGEPLMYGRKSIALLQALSACEQFADIHVETNGAIDLAPFLQTVTSEKVRYVMDYKLPDSSEHQQMHDANLALLRAQDELKFVISSENDFTQAKHILEQFHCAALPLFSPVWESMPPQRLAELILQHNLSHVKMSLQLHKLIWPAGQRGV